MDQTTTVTPLGKRRAIAAITVGNALEFYDFTVYGFMTSAIGRIFFPTLSPYAQILLAIAGFGVGFVARPLGGILIGSYADRHGRKKAMGLTITLMALGCAMLAFAPTPAQVGVLAPLIIVAARLIQGFSAGGEVGASTTFLVEYAGRNDRAYMASWQVASQGLGVMFGAIVASAVISQLSADALDSWGWRVPFVLGMAIAPIGMYIRRQLHETHSEDGPGATRTERRGKIRILFSSHWRELVQASLLFVSCTVGIYVIAFYLPTYAARELKLPVQVGVWAGVVFGIVNFIFAPLSGRLADRWGRKPIILWSRLCLLALLFPAFMWLVAEPSATKLYVSVAVLSVFLTSQFPALLVMLTEMFPRHVRATGLSVVYSTVVAVFSGFSPFFLTWLVHATGNMFAPAWYLLAITLISSLVIFWIDDRASGDLDETESSHGAGVLPGNDALGRA
ncbi:MFS transporter [Bordetella genomosp. 11]|uniref:MFS transporter n=1 Tax=Bordetella genomosp. 11 TaxID=1416808 RepID=A0A261UY82_9BORD|nr:MFS transporter [Bordetella genomosp. 11]OZI66527.1 MFS transporter [Bordetella genomosp. 11]